MDKKNLDTIRESFGRVVYSHKVHEKDAEIYDGYQNRVKIGNIILTALTSGSLLTTILTSQVVFSWASAILSTLSLGFTIFQLSYNPDKVASSHRQTAMELWKNREKHVLLITDIMNESIDKDEIAKRRDLLVDNLGSIYDHSLPTSPEAYKRAQKALKVDEELTFSEKEIDNFLPKELKLSL